MTTTTIEKLDPRSLGSAAAVVAATLFSLCSLAVALAPDATTAVAGYLVHANANALLPRSLSPASFLIGLIAWSAGAGAVFAAVAGLYNGMTRRDG